jgi:hypothetical protein
MEQNDVQEKKKKREKEKKEKAVSILICCVCVCTNLPSKQCRGKSCKHTEQSGDENTDVIQRHALHRRLSIRFTYNVCMVYHHHDHVKGGYYVIIIIIIIIENEKMQKNISNMKQFFWCKIFQYQLSKQARM